MEAQTSVVGAAPRTRDLQTTSHATHSDSEDGGADIAEAYPVQEDQGPSITRGSRVRSLWQCFLVR